MSGNLSSDTRDKGQPKIDLAVFKASQSNFNDSVMVKITPDGERVRDRYFRDLGMEPPPLKRDAQGYTEMQLNEVLLFFGKEMNNIQSRPPLEMTFLVGASQRRNFNDIVMVKITPDGESVRDRYFRDLGMEPFPLQRDAQGYTKMQLHEVLLFFGKEMNNIQSRLLLEMTFSFT